MTPHLKCGFFFLIEKPDQIHCPRTSRKSAKKRKKKKNKMKNTTDNKTAIIKIDFHLQ